MQLERQGQCEHTNLGTLRGADLDDRPSRRRPCSSRSNWQSELLCQLSRGLLNSIVDIAVYSKGGARCGKVGWDRRANFEVFEAAFAGGKVALGCHDIDLGSMEFSRDRKTRK